MGGLDDDDGDDGDDDERLVVNKDLSHKYLKLLCVSETLLQYFLVTAQNQNFFTMYACPTTVNVKQRGVVPL